MASVNAIIGFADFTVAIPLQRVASHVSAAIFAGIRFIPDPGGWDEVPCLRLERDFLGLRIQLGGSETSGYTLEIDTTLGASIDSLPGTEGPIVCDVSAMLKHQLAKIPGLTLSEPRY
jgi:hypothetical protein